MGRSNAQNTEKNQDLCVHLLAVVGRNQHLADPNEFLPGNLSTPPHSVLITHTIYLRVTKMTPCDDLAARWDDPSAMGRSWRGAANLTRARDRSGVVFSHSSITAGGSIGVTDVGHGQWDWERGLGPAHHGTSHAAWLARPVTGRHLVATECRTNACRYRHLPPIGSLGLVHVTHASL